jgi:hypothetical protein
MCRQSSFVSARALLGGHLPQNLLLYAAQGLLHPWWTSALLRLKNSAEAAQILGHGAGCIFSASRGNRSQCCSDAGWCSSPSNRSCERTRGIFVSRRWGSVEGIGGMSRSMFLAGCVVLCPLLLGLVISWTEDNDDQRLLMMFEGYVYKVTEADSEVESIYSDIRYRSFPRCYDGLCFFSIHFGGRMFIWIYQHKVFLIYV